MGSFRATTDLMGDAFVPEEESARNVREFAKFAPVHQGQMTALLEAFLLTPVLGDIRSARNRESTDCSLEIYEGGGLHCVPGKATMAAVRPLTSRVHYPNAAAPAGDIPAVSPWLALELLELC